MSVTSPTPIRSPRPPSCGKTQQIPGERGSVEAVTSLDALIGALQQGGAVIIHPEGTTTREPDLWPMRGRTGAAT